MDGDDDDWDTTVTETVNVGRFADKNSLDGDSTDETEIFNEKIRSNTQGSIESYEVLSTKKEGSNYKVRVRFDIRQGIT